MDVAVFRGDVEIAGQDQIGVGVQPFLSQGTQSLQPGKLIAVFVAIDG